MVKKWSQKITETDRGLDLEPGVFKKTSPHAIALSIRRSVIKSRRPKNRQLKSGIAMISFYINRAGKKLSRKRKQILMKSKSELRKML